MIDTLKATCGAALLLCLGALAPLLATEPAAFAKPADLPAFKLKDPKGALVASDTFKKSGAVLVFTIPAGAHGDLQTQWARGLTKTWGAKWLPLIFIEDLSQAPDKAKSLAKLTERYRADRPPLLLVDEAGAVRKSFGIAADTTELVLVLPGGKIAGYIKDEPELEAVGSIRGWIKDHSPPDEGE